MRIHRACLGIVLAVLAVATRAAAADVADVTGPWLLHAEWDPAFKYDMVCGLTQKDQAVSGTCMGSAPPERTTGSLDGAKLELDYTTTYFGNDVDTIYHGVVDGNGRVNGTVVAGQGQGLFEGEQIGASGGPVANWKLHVRIEAFDFQMLCAMRVKGRTLKGLCGAGDGVLLDASGTADAKGLTLAYDDGRLNAAPPVHVVYTGAFQGDGAVKGAATNGISTGTFTAKRR